MKKTILFLTALAAGFGAGAAAPENLLENPGFESDTSSWLVWGLYKKLPAAERASILVFDTTAPGAGRRSMRITDKWTDDGPYMVQIVPLPKGKALQLSFLAKAPAGQSFRYGVQFGTGSGMRDFKYLDARYVRGTGDGSWKKYELLLDSPPAGATLITPAFCPGSRTTTGTLRVDEVVLRVLDETDEAALLGIDREPVFRVNLPYQPADGSKPELNPTPFCWLPATGWSPDKITYSLEYSRDPSFRSADTVRRTGLVIHTEIPERVLEPGVWYWRYGVERPGRTVWSRTRKFEMRPRTAGAAVPDPGTDDGPAAEEPPPPLDHRRTTPRAPGAGPDGRSEKNHGKSEKEHGAAYRTQARCRAALPPPLERSEVE